MKINEQFQTVDAVSRASAEALEVALVQQIKDHEGGRVYLSAFFGQIQELYRNARNPEFMRAISEGLEWAKQNNLLVRDLTQQHEWHVLSRSGERFNSQRDLPIIHLVRLLPTEILHPTVRSSSLGIFRAGHFEAAVFEAFKVLEVAIREAAGYTERDYGTDMIARAFNAESGPLRDTQAPDAERQAMMRLMSGAHGVFKNPRSHRSIRIDDPIEAAEMLVLASHLMRIVDTARGAS